MAKFGVKDLIAMQVVRKTENGDCIISAVLRGPKGGVIAKRAKMTRFGWVNVGILIPALDKGEDIPQEEAEKLFGESMNGFAAETQEKKEEEITSESTSETTEKHTI